MSKESREARAVRMRERVDTRRFDELTKKGKKDVVVTTVKGDDHASEVIELMAKHGYEVQNHASRKVVFSATTGVFTKKQKHTLTFIRSATS